MSMGTEGMAGMGTMKMPVPKNSVPMLGGPGPFDYIDMGGMFTILKVRDKAQLEDGAVWYEHPADTVATTATAAELAADGIDPKSSRRASASGEHRREAPDAAPPSKKTPTPARSKH